MWITQQESQANKSSIIWETQHVTYVRVMSRWNAAMTAPSNSAPRPVFTVVGENAFQMMLSHWFVAMKREIPDPRP